jgi:hypothetical protein
MALLAIAFPIPADKVARWDAFIKQLNGAKKADFSASRKKLKVRERTFHQQTPQGDFAIVTLEGDDPAGAFAKFGQGTDPFTHWYAAQVMEIHSTHLDRPPRGPLPTLVVDSRQADFFSDLSKWFC